MHFVGPLNAYKLIIGLNEIKSYCILSGGHIRTVDSNLLRPLPVYYFFLPKTFLILFGFATTTTQNNKHILASKSNNS